MKWKDENTAKELLKNIDECRNKIDDVESFEEITTTKAKNICKALKEFSKME